MEKNVVKHVLADVFLITHNAKGERDTMALYELLRRSYRSRQMDWHEECLQMAWEQYRYWLLSSSAGPAGYGQQRKGRTRKKTRELSYPIRLEKRGRNEWEFAWPSEVLSLMSKFDLGCEHLEAGNINKARFIFNSILKECPYFIDALNHLAVIEWDVGNLAGAHGFYLQAYEIGRSVLPPHFRGKLPWGWVDNRPFLRTLHGLALVKLRQGDSRAAKELLEWVIKLDPDDHMGVRTILEDIRKGTVPQDE
ncbi:tetratricopeptide repeat protein [Desulfoscipio geothermicus]|uniref:Transcriptional repressor TCF25 n=1 Tax=Desulfoscipio geothermicus DSM 3669 TaxID=1121426 RepID=A0A1I6CP91_9FIRM|nr:tetratricopeptide repeat protein [Desulfoscipio geothermicus]SFQ94990.1 Transcriptional repressor TCF25 [Desulfoscipio geothermicus DSM 3669]